MWVRLGKKVLILAYCVLMSSWTPRMKIGKWGLSVILIKLGTENLEAIRGKRNACGTSHSRQSRARTQGHFRHYKGKKEEKDNFWSSGDIREMDRGVFQALSVVLHPGSTAKQWKICYEKTVHEPSNAFDTWMTLSSNSVYPCSSNRLIGHCNGCCWCSATSPIKIHAGSLSCCVCCLFSAWSWLFFWEIARVRMGGVSPERFCCFG